MSFTEPEGTQSLSTTKVDEVQHPENVVNINKDKLTKVKNKEITKAFETFEEIDKERAELNARRGEVTARLRKLGIPTAALNSAYARYKMNDDKRAEGDAAFAKCCNAMGVGYQSDLFSE